MIEWLLKFIGENTGMAVMIAVVAIYLLSRAGVVIPLSVRQAVYKLATAALSKLLGVEAAPVPAVADRPSVQEAVAHVVALRKLFSDCPAGQEAMKKVWLHIEEVQQ